MTHSSMAMFPGQGSQSVGMTKDLLSLFPSLTKPVLEEVDDTIKEPIGRFCLEGPEDELKQTRIQQPAILATSIAFWRVLVEEGGFTPQFFAGHSLGEYSALVASGRLALGEASLLVYRRGSAMQEAVPYGKGLMLAVLGMEEERLRAVLPELQKEGIVDLANLNSPVQQILSGEKEAVLLAGERLKKEGAKVKELPVSAPFHSRMMTPAKEVMAPLIGNSSFEPGSGRIYPNVTGKGVKTYDPTDLINQIDQSVLWTKTIGEARKDGAEFFWEVGPGQVLAGLAKRILPQGARIEFSSDIKKVLSSLQAQKP